MKLNTLNLMYVVPYILVIYTFNSGPTRCTLYYVFVSSLANDETNKEYSVHLVGPELNIYKYIN
jgi:hypothetical protein